MSALLLTRRPREKVIINTGREVIEVIVTGIKGNQARLAFVADSHVMVDREEVYNAKMADKDG